jgi:predicted Zn-dependent peptidase
VKALALTLAAGVALLGAAPSPAPAPARFPAASSSYDGTTRIFVESDAGAQLAGLQIFVGAGLARQTASTGGVAALTAECLLRTPVGGVALRDAVAAGGGSLDYTVDARSTHFYLEGLADRMPALAGLVTRALTAPGFSPVAVAAARAQLEARVDDSASNAIATGVEMFRRSYYSGPAGLPALGSRSSLSNLGPDEVTAFFKANYLRGSASLSAVGRIVPELAAAEQSLVGALPEGTLPALSAKAPAIPAESPRIVARRDVGAPIVVVGFAAANPGSADFGAMLVLQSLLANALERPSTTSLGLRERSVGAFYLYDATPASLIVYVNGNRVDPSLAIHGLSVLAASLAQHALTPDVLRRYKSVAEGAFLNDTITLADRSYLLGAFGSLGYDNDPVNAALTALDAATAADVQRAAKRYLQRSIVALVLPRQASPGN